VYALVFTYMMLRVLDLITPVHVGAEEERGLDAAELGEAAYTFETASSSVGWTPATRQPR
jgi:ammonia channel protein AmtB